MWNKKLVQFNRQTCGIISCFFKCEIVAAQRACRSLAIENDTVRERKANRSERSYKWMALFSSDKNGCSCRLSRIQWLNAQNVSALTTIASASAEKCHHFVVCSKLARDPLNKLPMFNARMRDACHRMMANLSDVATVKKDEQYKTSACNVARKREMRVLIAPEMQGKLIASWLSDLPAFNWNQLPSLSIPSLLPTNCERGWSSFRIQAKRWASQNDSSDGWYYAPIAAAPRDILHDCPLTGEMLFGVRRCSSGFLMSLMSLYLMRSHATHDSWSCVDLVQAPLNISQVIHMINNTSRQNS